MRGTRGLFGGMLLASVLSGCTVPYAGGGHDGEDFGDGHIYVTDMLGHGCEYDAAEKGTVFMFTLTGHKDADMIAEVHRARRGADEHHPGPVIASERLPIRDGKYDNPITMVVPLEESDYDAARTRCVLQTENYGPDIINAP